jgi:hypothetical protein
VFGGAFFNGIVVRGKGFPSPLINPCHLPESAVCGVVLVLGIIEGLWAPMVEASIVDAVSSEVLSSRAALWGRVARRWDDESHTDEIINPPHGGVILQEKP